MTGRRSLCGFEACGWSLKHERFEACGKEKGNADSNVTMIRVWASLIMEFFFRIRGVYSKTHNRSSNHAERVRAPTFSNTERSQYSGLDCAVMPDMSSLGFSCGSVEVAIVWCGSTQDHASSRTLRPRQISRGFLDDG